MFTHRWKPSSANLCKRVFRKTLFVFIIPFVLYTLVIGDFYNNTKINYALTHLPIVTPGAVTTCLVQRENGLLQVNATGACGPEPCRGLWSCSQQMCQVFERGFELHDTAMISVTPFVNLSKTNSCAIPHSKIPHIENLQPLVLGFGFLYVVISFVILVLYSLDPLSEQRESRCCSFCCLLLAVFIVILSVIPVVMVFVIDYYLRKHFLDETPAEIRESEYIFKLIQKIIVGLEAIHRTHEIQTTLKKLISCSFGKRNLVDPYATIRTEDTPEGFETDL